MIDNRTVELNPHWTKKPDNNYPFHRWIFNKIWPDLPAKPMVFITGPRRTGKSILLKQMILRLILDGVSPTQILFFEFAPRDNTETIREVWHYFKSLAKDTEKRFIFFDEPQYIDGFESVLKEIYDNNENLKITVTGSLSLFYKRKMEDSLSGRYFPYRLFPLNFREYLELVNSPLKNFDENGLSQDKFLREAQILPLNRDFREFLSLRRLPETAAMSPELAKTYIKTIINQSLTTDAFNFFTINKPQIILALFSYIQNNNGSEISARNLSQICGANIETINKYLEILEIMGLVYAVSNSLDPIAKLNGGKKYYVSSHFALIEPKYEQNTAMGFAVESYILERLLEKDETVTFFRNRQKEVDFLLPKKKIGYEVKFRQNYATNKEGVFAPEGFEIKTITPFGDLPACLF